MVFTMNNFGLVYGNKKNRVFVEEPHPGSRASLILLHDQLGQESLKEWFDFRDSFLDEELTRLGILKCFYCGKHPLVKEVDDPTDKGKLHWLATLDHVNARANGGGEYDKGNLVIACFPCNNGKSDTPLDQWQKKKRGRSATGRRQQT